MSSSAITIAYDLHPPLDSDAATGSSNRENSVNVNGAGGGASVRERARVRNLVTSNRLSFPLERGQGQSQEEYYAALGKAIAQAKEKIGDDLTAWRDAVGKAELSKETPKTLKYDQDEEEDEDEEDENGNSS